MPWARPKAFHGGYAQHDIFQASRDQQDGRVGTWTFCKHLKLLRCLLEGLSNILVALSLGLEIKVLRTGSVCGGATKVKTFETALGLNQAASQAL